MAVTGPGEGVGGSRVSILFLVDDHKPVLQKILNDVPGLTNEPPGNL